MTLHRISGIKVNARAWQNDTIDNRQCAKLHADVQALSQMERLIKDSAFVFIARLTQSLRVRSNKEVCRVKKKQRTSAKWHSGE